jgi:hypothetical protein
VHQKTPKIYSTTLKSIRRFNYISILCSKWKESKWNTERVQISWPEFEISGNPLG